MPDLVMRLFEWIDSPAGGVVLGWTLLSVLTGLLFAGWIGRRKEPRLPKGWKEQPR